MTVEETPGVSPIFRMAVHREAGNWEVKFSGQLEGAHEGRIQQELEQLHHQLLAGKAQTVTLDVHQVDHMSSTALKVLAGWFCQIAQTQAYQVRITYHPEREWQVWSLGALRTLAPGRIRLEPLLAPAKMG